MKKALTVLVTLGAMAAAGYYGYERFLQQPPPALQIVTANVSRGDVIQGIAATGRLEAVTTVQVGSQVSGTIKALYADFNSQVRRGQVVAELEPSLFQTQVEQAEASLVRVQADVERSRVQLEDARLKLSRARDLAARQLLPQADLETAQANARTAESVLKSTEAQLVQAQASLNQTKVNLSHTVITAPIDGVVISRNVDVGQTVAASMQAPTLFQIANDMAQMRVSANIDESDIGKVRSGQDVTFIVDAYPERSFRGTVEQVRLNPVIESNVVSYVTVIKVPNPELLLRPGMTANVTIEVARVDDTLRVPASALRFSPTPEVFASLGQTPPEPVTADAVPALNTAGGQVQGGSGGPEDGASEPTASGGGIGPAGDAFAGAGRQGGFSEEQRTAMRERFAQMSPDERDAMIAARGGRAGGGGGRGRGDGAGRGGNGERRVRGTSPAANGTNAPRPAQLWAVVDGKLIPVQVLASISDGANVAVSGGGLQEGVAVVTGQVQTTAAAVTPPGGGNPLLPNFGRGRFGGGRGFGGGGGGRGQ